MRHALALVLMLSSLTFAARARADVPAWTDDDAFEQFCEQLRGAIGCPDCQCSAITQSNPTEDAAEASDIPTALVVELTGTADDGARTVRVLRAVLGSDKGLFDGGTLADLSTTSGDVRTGQVEVVRSEQRMDMCPGACPHTPVGMVHAFELKSVWLSGVDVNPSEGIETLETTLALCFAPAEGKAPGCWLVPVGGGTQAVHFDVAGDGKDKVGKQKLWSRTWKLSPSGEVQLVLGAIKGTAPRDIAQGPVAKAPKKGHLKGLTDRADVKAAKR